MPLAAKNKREKGLFNEILQKNQQGRKVRPRKPNNYKWSQF